MELNHRTFFKWLNEERKEINVSIQRKQWWSFEAQEVMQELAVVTETLGECLCCVPEFLSGFFIINYGNSVLEQYLKLRIINYI